MSETGNSGDGVLNGPRLFIDADGFPNLEMAIEIAGSFQVNTVVVGNYTQNLDRLDGLERVEIMEVSEGADAADFAIIPMLNKGDILLTNDTGLAAVALAAGTMVLNAKGDEYSEATIDQRLLQRHIGRKTRRRGGRTKGPNKYSDKDMEKFEKKLRNIMEE